MKKIKKLLLPMLLLFAVVMINYGANNDEIEQTNMQAGSGSDTITIENGDVQVVYDVKQKFLTIQDPYGYSWDSVVHENLYSSEKLNDTWEKNVRSILHITYGDISDKNPSLKKAFSNTAEITAQKVGEEISLVCDFKDAGISMTLLIKADENEVSLSIPASEIKEYKNYRLLTVDVLPYMGACADTEDGYLVYPDGSGALKYHNSVPPATMSNSLYSWDIYGNDLQSLETLSNNESQDIETAMLPVFGIKKGEHALIAYSETGEEEGSINMCPSGYGIALNRMFYSFRYRTSYNIQMSNISINGSDTAKDSSGIMYNEEMIKQDHDVHYSFLNNDKADYSGMAELYREILLVDGKLQKTDMVSETGVSVNVLMAASEQGFWSNSIAVTTTAEQVEKIVETVEQSGFSGKGIYTLQGWSNGGYGVYPQTAKPDQKVASVSALNHLLQSDKRFLLQTELLFADEENGDFSKRTDVIKLGNQNVITDHLGQRFIFNASCFSEKLQEIHKTYNSSEQINLSLQSIGKVLFRDENEKIPMHRGEIRDELEGVLQQASDKGTISVEGANLYTLKYADMIYGLPSSSSEYFISDANIPFCQMVLHGSVVYTGEYGNLSSNYDRQLLEWLEYGYTPAFVLTYSSSEVLKDTNCSDIYTSQYENNVERIKKAYQLYNDVISKIADSYISEHTVLEDGFIKVNYSNQYTVLINYTAHAKSWDGITVESGSYVMVGE